MNKPVSRGNHYDVIVVGAGIVGATMAVALSGSDLNIALVEASELRSGWPPIENTVTGYDVRVSAITPASKQFLDDIHVWEDIASQRFSPYFDMNVWDGDGTASIQFSAKDYALSELGFVVENRIIAAALINRLRELRDVSLHSESLIEAIEQVDGGGYCIDIKGGERLSAEVLIAADGANSCIRNFAGFDTRQWSYGQTAIVATVKTGFSHKDTAIQRFSPSGPLAFLPLADSDDGQRLCSIVWSVTDDIANDLMALEPEDFKQHLAEAIEMRLGRIESLGSRRSFPLQQQHAVDYVKPGLALIGDAAHSIHPLAGQGVNLGLKDANCMVKELLRAKQRGLGLGDIAVLKRYQRSRKSDNLAMMAAMDGFKRLFEQPDPAIRWVRNAGMAWLDRRNSMKSFLVARAAGLSG